MSKKPKVAVIGTGGTITSIGKGPLDLQEYTATGKMLEADELAGKFPEIKEYADIVPVRVKAVPSTAVAFTEWRQVIEATEATAKKHPDIAGFVVLHGTASLEETAYALNLTAKVAQPIVVVGAQRPASALSTDAGLNLVNAVRTAGSPLSRGLGVLVCLNDEVQAAREVTKTSTARLQTFKTPDFGALGHVDGDGLAMYRKPIRRHAPDTEFDIRGLDKLPRVDITYSYAGADGTAVRAFVAAGAKGIVAAGFAPGLTTPAEAEALVEAIKKGVVVAISSRAGSGRVYRNGRAVQQGMIAADNLNPQKARILLSLALTKTTDRAEIDRMFLTY